MRFVFLFFCCLQVLIFLFASSFVLCCSVFVDSSSMKRTSRHWKATRICDLLLAFTMCFPLLDLLIWLTLSCLIFSSVLFLCSIADQNFRVHDLLFMRRWAGRVWLSFVTLFACLLCLLVLFVFVFVLFGLFCNFR